MMQTQVREAILAVAAVAAVFAAFAAIAVVVAAVAAAAIAWIFDQAENNLTKPWVSTLDSP